MSCCEPPSMLECKPAMSEIKASLHYRFRLRIPVMRIEGHAQTADSLEKPMAIVPPEGHDDADIFHVAVTDHVEIFNKSRNPHKEI